MEWFKFYGQDFLTDSKLGALNPLQRLMWVTILCIASQDDERTGIIKFLTEDRVKELCGVTDNPNNNDWDRTQKTIDKFCDMGLIKTLDKNTIIIVNFNRKQTQKTTSAERVSAWRERQKNKEEVTNVTNVALQSNGRIEKNRVEKKRVDKNTTTYSKSFSDFWKAYPRKVGKGAAWKAWSKIVFDGKYDTIIKAIKAQRDQEQWTRDNGQFIPHPATWLNQRRWEDEVSKPRKVVSIK